MSTEGIFASNQVGVPESWAGVIANIDVGACPLTSMIKKGTKPANVLDNWQAKKYKAPSHKPVVDGSDVEKYENVQERKRLQGRVQKIWRNPKTSDFADHVNQVDGLSGNEHDDQIATALVLVKRGIECRLLCNEDSAEDDGSAAGSATRGLFKWIDSAAQGDLPVPEQFRTPAANIYSGTLANFDVETSFRSIHKSIAKQRKGPGTIHGFVGIDLQSKFIDSTIWTPNKTSYTAVRSYDRNADAKTLTYVAEVVQTEGGTMVLHPSFFLYTDEDGEETAFTHKSGLFLDMDMLELAYNRMPRVLPQENQGGGERAIVDAIFSLRCLNPLGSGAAKISS